MRKLLDGIRQFGIVTNRVLERRVDGAWQTVYTAFGLAIPFVRAQVTYIANVRPEATSA